MAILGVLIDRTTVSRAGNAGTNANSVGLSTLAHSLPATNPEAVFINLRSIEQVAVFGNVIPQIFALGGNASLLTIGTSYQVPAVAASAISAPAIMYDVISEIFHSVIR